MYFAYGSNLDLVDLYRWCVERGHPDARPRLVGPAWLPDHELVFHYRSAARGGGALDVRPRRGAAVPGALLACDDAAWDALDEKEGAGRTYARVAVRALGPDGALHEATTYQVTDAFREPRHVPPTSAYVETVERGLRAIGWPVAHLHAAARGSSTPWPDALFVYGTLMRGELRAPLLGRHRPREWSAARAPGRLVDLGAYPGLVPGSGLVHGERVRVADLPAALAQLDEVEDFAGYGDPENLYRRVITRAVDRAGASCLAWTYRYLGEDGAPLASGDWRARQGAERSPAAPPAVVSSEVGAGPSSSGSSSGSGAPP